MTLEGNVAEPIWNAALLLPVPEFVPDTAPAGAEENGTRKSPRRPTRDRAGTFSTQRCSASGMRNCALSSSARLRSPSHVYPVRGMPCSQRVIGAQNL